jgi:hypothetical protein
MAINPNNQDYISSPLNKSLADKFLLVLKLPEALKPINEKFRRDNKSIQLDTLQFSIWGAVVPKISVPAIDLKYMGANFPISSHFYPAWDPVTIKFEVDNLWSNYWVIYQWLNLMRNDKAGIMGGISDKQKLIDGASPVRTYSSDMTVYALDEYEEPRIKWTYTYAFPTNLGDIQFSERETKQIECNFTFQFSQLLCELV